MPEKMSTGKRRTIYGMATQLGIYDKDNKDDDLHALVLRVTGKESIGQLTEKEANLVIREMVKLKGGQTTKTERNARKKKDLQNHRPGMISPAQQRAVWFQMYRLEELDTEPPQLSRAERLCAIIKKYLRVDAAAKDPFRFVTLEDGGTLIEVLKKMVRYEERRAGKIPQRCGGGGNGR